MSVIQAQNLLDVEALDPKDPYLTQQQNQTKVSLTIMPSVRQDSSLQVYPGGSSEKHMMIPRKVLQ